MCVDRGLNLVEGLEERERSRNLDMERAEVISV